MRGEAARHRDADPEQLLFNYLSAVSDAASGKLSPAVRARFVDSLRESITKERARQGTDATTLGRVLEAIGDPITIVDAEMQRDPSYQAALSARLSAAARSGPQEPILDDLAELLAPAVHGAQQLVPPARAATPGLDDSGPQWCLDPDPFTSEHVVETVGALTDANATMFAPVTLAETGPAPSAMEAEVAQAVERARAAWRLGPRLHPWEAVSITMFLIGAVFGFWLLLIVAGLVACTSRFYSELEKWTLVIGVPVATVLCYTIGFWLFKHSDWGGHQVTTADMLSGAASFFGTLPRMAALFAALFLSWRLARGITRQQ